VFTQHEKRKKRAFEPSVYTKKKRKKKKKKKRREEENRKTFPIYPKNAI